MVTEQQREFDMGSPHEFKEPFSLRFTYLRILRSRNWLDFARWVFLGGCLGFALFVFVRAGLIQLYNDGYRIPEWMISGAAQWAAFGALTLLGAVIAGIKSWEETRA